MSRRTSPRRVLILAVLVLATAAACTTEPAPAPDPDIPALEQIRQATFDAGSAHYAGTVTFGAGGTGPVDGAVQVDPQVGQVTYPLSSGGQDVRALWTDGSLYIRRATTADPHAVSALVRTEADLPWVTMPYAGLGTALIVAYDPFALLDQLIASKVQAEPDGTEDVDGTTLQRFVVDMTNAALPPGGAKRIELLTNTAKRLEGVRLLGDDTIEYALSDFGTKVSVSPPSADQIATGAIRPSYEPTGPYEMVASGASGPVGWQLYRAPATEGTCWRLDTTSPLDPVAATQPDGATCVADVDPTASIDEQVQIVADAGSQASFDGLVAVAPPGSQASLQFADRSTIPLTVDPQGFVVWVGPKPPLAIVLSVTAPDGSQTSCAPGTVTEVADLQELPAEELAKLDRSPWLCIA